MDSALYLEGRKPRNKDSIFGWKLEELAKQYGKDEQSVVNDALQRLALKMALDGMYSGSSSDNPEIPAGYTYLGQLIAHDTIFNRTADLAAFGSGVHPPFASPEFDLDCIYRGGPERSPSLYAYDGANGNERCLLRVGCTAGNAWRTSDSNPAQPWLRTESLPLDLPSLSLNGKATNSNEVGRNQPGNHCPADMLIGDPRNDDNIILSQITVLFHCFHNRVCEILGPKVSNARERFEISRMIVSDRYRAVIAEDYLKRMIDPAVADDLHNGNIRRIFTNRLKKYPELPLPAEFWLAIMRVGHAMIRPSYEINNVRLGALYLSDILNFRQVSLHNPNGIAGRPISNDWLVDLRRFFPAAGETEAIPSRLIRPACARTLHDAPHLQPSIPSGMRLGSDIAGGLPFRDMARGYFQGLPNAQYVARLMAIKPLSPAELKGDKDGFGLRGMYGAPHINNPLVDADLDLIEAFAEDTPLAWYILREAEVENGGKHLGRLGSAILGDVMLAFLERATRNPPKQLGTWRKKVFGGSAPTKMREIVDFVMSKPTAGCQSRPKSQVMA